MSSLLRNIIGSQKLLTSHLYNEKAFYWAFRHDLKKAKKSVIIESPYLTESRTRYLMPLFRELNKRGVRIRINTRHPKLHDRIMKTQAERALSILKATQVKLYFYNDFRHWKLAAIDKSILWEGSLNILSHAKSKEVMRRINSPYLCRQMLRFINTSS